MLTRHSGVSCCVGKRPMVQREVYGWKHWHLGSTCDLQEILSRLLVPLSSSVCMEPIRAAHCIRVVRSVKWKFVNCSVQLGAQTIWAVLVIDPRKSHQSSLFWVWLILCFSHASSCSHHASSCFHHVSWPNHNVCGRRSMHTVLAGKYTSHKVSHCVHFSVFSYTTYMCEAWPSPPSILRTLHLIERKLWCH